MEKKPRVCFKKWILAGFLSVFLTTGTLAWSAPKQHTVKAGDTLQSICEQYYGDAELMPKLWEKNPSVTDPEKLPAGLIILLLEDVPIRKTPSASEKKTKAPRSLDVPSIQTTGVDVSDYCKVDTLGFLSPEPVTPWGRISADETERIFLAKYDKVFVLFEKDRKVKPGDRFTLYKQSENLGNILTESDVAHEVTFLGTIVLLAQVPERENVFEAQIENSYRVMRVGDPVLPYRMVSPCVQPTDPDWQKCEDPLNCAATIVDSRDQKELMGQYSVVYINRGYKNGIRRGNLFAIVDHMDAAAGDKKDLPDLVLGYLLVLEARLQTATAVVLKAKKEFRNGIAIKAVNLEKALRQTMTAQGLDPVEKLNSNHKLVPTLLKLGEQIDLKTTLPESLHVLYTMVKCSPN